MSFAGKQHAAGSRARIAASLRLARERRKKERDIRQVNKAAETVSASVNDTAKPVRRPGYPH